MSSNKELINIVNNIERLEPQFKTYDDNLSKEERKALQTLRNNKDIVIKPSDKGGGWIKMDTGYYT